MARSRPGGRLLWPLALIFLAAMPLAAAEVEFFLMRSRSAYLRGTFDGISVDALGTLRLASRAERVADIEEPFLFAAAPHPAGWVLGTGNAGKVLLLSRDGTLTELFAAPEPEIFAVWVDADGTVFAGSSPQGKIYRIPAAAAGAAPAGGDGELGAAAEVFFDPEETYIWALARGADGALLAATGTEGRLYRVTGQDEGKIFYDSEDTHLRALKALPSGDLLVGTAGEGLVLRLDREGRARTLYDAAQPEVVAFAVDPESTCYAAVLASEASLTVLPPPVKREEAEEDEEEEGGEEGAAQPEREPGITVILEEEEPGVAPGRPRGFKGARSEVLEIDPSGRVETLRRFDDETVYALYWHDGRLWAGTGLEGKVYSLRGDDLVLEKDVDERQVVALLPEPKGEGEEADGLAFATTNAAAFFRLTDQAERSGSFTSPSLDGEQISRFGTLHWRGEVPRGADLEFSFRSGVSAEPDRTWSEWTPPRRGEEIPLEGVPSGRYLQWRAAFTADGGESPALAEVRISYRQENLAPRIEGLLAMDAGEILVPANFNPSNQVFEPAHPNRQGIFTTLEPGDERSEGRLKTLWKYGFLTLRWKADDPNEDSLVYRLAFRPAAADAGDEWLPMAEDLEESYYSFDALALPDGLYRFRLEASDRPSNAGGESLVSEEVSEPVLIDHSVPELRRSGRSGGALEAEIEDASSPLREAVFSINAGEWRPAEIADGLLDGRRETLRMPLPAGAGLVLLRVTDAAFNTVTFDLSREAR